MKLIFPNQPEAPKDCTILKETKKYITFRCKTNLMKYRYNKETDEVQDGTCHDVIKGLKVDCNAKENNHVYHSINTD